MQGMKDTAANIAASAVAGMEKTKATVQEKLEKMTTHDPEQKEMARERKQERITQAELDKQEAKQYRAAASKYGASATGGQGYYSSEATGGCMTSGHDKHTRSATEDTGYPMGAHQTSAMRGHGTGKQYGGQEEEGVVSTYPGGLPGDSTTRRNTRAGGIAFRTGTDGTGQSYGTDGTEYTTGTDGTGYGSRQPYGGQEEGVVSTYPGGHPGDNTSGRNTRAGGTAFRTGTDGTGQSYGTDGTEYMTGIDGTGYGTRQPYGEQEEGVVSTYQGGHPGDSNSGRNTRAGGTAFRTGTDNTGYTTRTDYTGYGTRQPYGRQVEEGVENIYPDGLPGDSTTDHNTRADGNAFRTGTDGTGYTTRQSYGRQVEGSVENIYPDGLPGDSITDHNTRAYSNAFRTGTDGTGYMTGVDDTGYGTRQSYGMQVEEGVENIYPDGFPGDSITDHNTRADGNAFRTRSDGTRYETRQPYGGQVEDGVEIIYPDGLPGDSTSDHNTRAGGNAFRTGNDGTGYTTRNDGTGYTTGTGTGNNAPDWRL